MGHSWLEFCRENNFDQKYSHLSDQDVREKWTAFVRTHYQEPIPQLTERKWD